MRPRLCADQEILRLLTGGAPAHAAVQPALLPPPLDTEPVQNAADTEDAASAGADVRTAEAAGGKALARWAAFAPPAEAQPPGDAAAQPAGACTASGEAAAVGTCSTHASGTVARQVSGPEREREAGGASAAGGRALALPPVPRRRPLHDAAAVHAALGSARAAAAAQAPAGNAGCLAPGLHFPGAAEAAAAVRRVSVPDTFSGGAQQYERVFVAALVEELNLRLLSLCRRCDNPVRLRCWLKPHVKLLMPIQPITSSRADTMPHAPSCAPNVAPALHLGRDLRLSVQGLRHTAGLVARLAPSGRAMLAGRQGAAQPPKGPPCSAPAARRACSFSLTATSASGSRALAAAAAATARRRSAQRTQYT